MASAVKFEDFVDQLCQGAHDLDGTDTLKIYLSNATPSTSADAFKADLAEITAENGYTAGGEDTLNTGSETGGTFTVSGTDVVWTASGGTFGPFRYVVLYNDTHASDALIVYWDYGSSITPDDGETFTVDFGASILTVS